MRKIEKRSESNPFDIFRFREFKVRITDKEENPWFVAKDICRVLEIKNHRDACLDLDEDEKDSVGITDAMGRPQKTLAISESGVYYLVSRSRKPEAKKFRRWLRKRVLPAIRKTGSYSLKEPITRLEALSAVVQEMVKQEQRLNRFREDVEEDIKWINKKVRRLLRAEERVEDIDIRLSEIERNIKEKDLLLLPAPKKEVPEKTVRAQISQIVGAYTQNNSLDYEDAWNVLYREFRLRYRIDLNKRKANYIKKYKKQIRRTQIAENIGVLGDLYALAVKIFVD